MELPITISCVASWSAKSLRSGACGAELDKLPSVDVNYVPEVRIVTGASSERHLPRDVGLIPSYAKPKASGS